MTPPPMAKVHTLVTEYAERMWTTALARRRACPFLAIQFPNTFDGAEPCGRTQASGRRLRPELGRLLEGQKVLVMQCSTKGCRHYTASSADACVMEEARVQPPTVWLTRHGESEANVRPPAAR